MSGLPQTDDYRGLLLGGVPLMDTRAPVEFDQGAFPGAENRPLLTDEERHRVGIRYKEAGQDAAIELGYRLVSAEEKARRIAAWEDFARRHPEGALYCFRGGLRSRLTQRMLAEETGRVLPRVRGGYKALRRFCIETTEAFAAEIPLRVVGGRTGSGKTLLIAERGDAVDLEGLAHHRGSAFGARGRPQPAQIDVENRLAVALLRHREHRGGGLVVEDESRNIGSRQLPLVFYRAMQAAPLAVVERPTAERVEIALADYVHEPLAELRPAHGEAAVAAFGERARKGLDRIRKRLGGQRHREFGELLDAGLAEIERGAELDAMRAFIRRLLTEYYDPMYDYQLAKRAERIAYRGDPRGVQEWLDAAREEG